MGYRDEKELGLVRAMTEQWEYLQQRRTTITLSLDEDTIDDTEASDEVEGER